MTSIHQDNSCRVAGLGVKIRLEAIWCWCGCIENQKEITSLYTKTDPPPPIYLNNSLNCYSSKWARKWRTNKSSIIGADVHLMLTEVCIRKDYDTVNITLTEIIKIIFCSLFNKRRTKNMFQVEFVDIIYLSVVYLRTVSSAQTVQRRMIDWLKYNELKRIRKEVVVV
jgi:hypothetical protein